MKPFRAFTLLETLVFIFVFVLVVMVVVNTLTFFYRGNRGDIQELAQVDSARRGLELAVRDLREAAYAENGSYPLYAIASSSVVFFSDVQGDAVVERVTYALFGTTLYRGVLSPSGTPPSYTGAAATTTVSTNVRNFASSTPVFRYYKSNGTEITDMSRLLDVAFITASLVIDVNPLTEPPPYTLTTSAALRNAKPR